MARPRTALAVARPFLALAAVFALDTGAHELDGVPFLAHASASLEVRPRAGAVIAELVIPELCVQRAAIEGPWKLIETVVPAPPAERATLLAGLDARRARVAAGEVPPSDPFAPAERHELYELAADPGETRDLAASSPAELGRLRAILERYAEACRRSGLAARAGPVPEVEVEPGPEAELRQLGYF